MDPLRLLCQGSAPLLAKARLAICLLSAAAPSLGAAHRCFYVLVIICGSGSLSGVSGEKASVSQLYFVFIA